MDLSRNWCRDFGVSLQTVMKRFGLREKAKADPQSYALGVKEVRSTRAAVTGRSANFNIEDITTLVKAGDLVSAQTVHPLSRHIWRFKDHAVA